MKKIISIIVVILVSQAVFAEGIHFRGVPLFIARGDDTKITYYLEVASSEDYSDTLLIALQGSLCESVLRSKFLNRHSKSVWPNADILLIEKYGISQQKVNNGKVNGCPEQYIKNDTPERRVVDLELVLKDILSHHKYHNILVMGGSEGSAVAAIFASRNKLVNAVILINGGGRWFVDDILFNMKSTVPPDQYTKVVKGFKQFVESIKDSKALDIELSGHGFNWWKSVLSMDLLEIYKKISAPTLVVQGGNDQNVSPVAVKELMENVKKAVKDNIEFAYYPSLNHSLSKESGESMAHVVTADVAKWLKGKY